jgi:O-antigen/teichoic acid export membrane protein
MPILLGLFIAHRWGLEELAAYTLANASIAIALIAVDWGAQRALPRNLATLTPTSAERLLGSANAFRLLVVAALFAIGALAVLMGRVDRGVALYLVLLAPLCLLILITGNAIGERVVAGSTRAIGLALVSGLAVFALLGSTVLAMKLGPHWFVAAYVCGKTVEAIVIVAGRWWVLTVHKQHMFPTALALWPFAAQAVLSVIYSRLAVFTVENFTTRADLGLFSFAVAIQGSFLLVPGSLALVYFPDLTRRTAAGDFSGIRAIVRRYTIVSCLGILLGMGVLAVAIRPMSTMFGLPPGGDRFILAFVSVAILSVFSTMLGFRVQAGGHEGKAARLSVLTLLFAAVYQVIALSWFGVWGVVAAVAASDLTSIALFAYALKKTRPSA